MKRLADTGWIEDKSTSRPSRGIIDYNRDITYDMQLTEEEIRSEKDDLAKDKCPGIWGVSCQHVKDSNYRFRTTFDSSD